MCVPIHDGDMLNWLKTQARVIEAWRSELILRDVTDLGQLERLERHLAWLTLEAASLEEEDQGAGQAWRA